MDAELLNEAWKVYGALGFVAFSGWAVAWVVWKQLVKLQSDYHETSVSTTAALVELTVFIRDVRRP